MSNDFASLLSVFRDATSTSTTSSAAGSSNKRDTNNKTSDSSASATQKKPATSLKSSDIDPTSTKDPSFSAPQLKERIERILRIQQIRQSTSKVDDKCPTDNNSMKKKSLHIAICATIVDEFPHEALWRKWINETGGELILDDSDDSGSSGFDVKSTSESNSIIMTTAEMYVHAKNPERVRSEWLRSKTIPITHRPNWNDIRIVRAILSLLEAALSDEKTTHILLCTESCIPIATLLETGRSVLLDEVCNWEERKNDDDKKQSGDESQQKHISSKRVNWDCSYIDCYDRKSSRCTRFDEHNCWDILRNSVPGETIYKALPGWCFLSRKHAQDITNLPSQLGGMNLWPAFERVWAPEEVFIPTALAICGHMNNNEVSRRALTHSQWDERAANHKDRAHPLTYDGYFDDKLVSRVRRDGCLFMRKLKMPLDVSTWDQIIVQKRRGHSAGYSQDLGRGRGDIQGRGRGHDDDRRRYHSQNERQHGGQSRNYVSRRRQNNDYQNRKRDRSDYSSYDEGRKHHNRRW